MLKISSDFNKSDLFIGDFYIFKKVDFKAEI